MPEWKPRDYLVLLVEDDPDVARYIDKSLGEMFKVEGVTTCADADARLCDAPPVDAVILDLLLPNGEGLDVIRFLAKGRPFLPIVVFTGTDITPEEAIAAGACELIHKPLASPRALFAAVVEAIARKAAWKATAPAVQAVEALGKTLKESKEKLSQSRSKAGK